MTVDNDLIRCPWADTDPLYVAYHDNEWGKPLHDDLKLFEMLNLEGAQAGLSWLIILKKRPAYVKAFDNFSPGKIVSYDDKKISELLLNQGIVRNRLKIEAVIKNAQSYLDVQKEFGSFDNYIWCFTDHKQLTRTQHTEATKVSAMMSKDLKKRGFKFVGPTICYAFIQAVGLINDHEPYCFLA